MVGRIVVEMFRSSANSGTKINISEVLQTLQPIIEDTGKSCTIRHYYSRVLIK